MGPPMCACCGPSKLNNNAAFFDLASPLWVFSLSNIFCTSRCSAIAFALPVLHRKEVIQPHLPIRLPCYDLTPITEPTVDHFDMGFGYFQFSWFDGRCVQSPGTYSPRHADPRLLAIPTSCRRVAACNLNWGVFYEFCSASRLRFSLFTPL